jgi:hypothetical protein
MFREVLILCATSVFSVPLWLFLLGLAKPQTQRTQRLHRVSLLRLAVPCERRKINALTGNHKFPLTNPSGYGTTRV